MEGGGRGREERRSEGEMEELRKRKGKGDKGDEKG